jgi:hypothetical protein
MCSSSPGVLKRGSPFRRSAQIYSLENCVDSSAHCRAALSLKAVRIPEVGYARLFAANQDRKCRRMAIAAASAQITATAIKSGFAENSGLGESYTTPDSVRVTLKRT